MLRTDSRCRIISTVFLGGDNTGFLNAGFLILNVCVQFSLDLENFYN